MTRHIIFLIFIALGFGAGTANATPNTHQPIDNKWDICPSAVQAAEAKAAVPKHLLSAISRAESGRWHPRKQVNIAWPWTVTANGKGRFFDSKAEALAETEILLTQGVRNIDVGCMQINLMHHGNAFETLSTAFDPTANAKYGAEYLRAMYAKTKDWRKAAARYHSATPKQAAKYRAKVLRLWNEARNGVSPKRKAAKPVEIAEAEAAPHGEPETETIEATADRARPSDINFGLSQRLNAAFQDRRERSAGEELADRAARRAHETRKQLDAWRQQQTGGLSLVHLANMRRAELAQRRQKQLHRVSASDRKEAFAERRRHELELWRARRATPHLFPYPR